LRTSQLAFGDIGWLRDGGGGTEVVPDRTEDRQKRLNMLGRLEALQHALPLAPVSLDFVRQRWTELLEPAQDRASADVDTAVGQQAGDPFGRRAHPAQA
jgi:hypothetical protein